jgi:hypothetical protein
MGVTDQKTVGLQYTVTSSIFLAVVPLATGGFGTLLVPRMIAQPA